MDSIGKFEKVLALQADDLSYGHSILLCITLERSLSSLRHALVVHNPLSCNILDNRMKAIMGNVEGLCTWANNYQKGLVDKTFDKGLL